MIRTLFPSSDPVAGSPVRADTLVVLQLVLLFPLLLPFEMVVLLTTVLPLLPTLVADGISVDVATSCAPSIRFTFDFTMQQDTMEMRILNNCIMLSAEPSCSYKPGRPSTGMGPCCHRFDPSSSEHRCSTPLSDDQ